MNDRKAALVRALAILAIGLEHRPRKKRIRNVQAYIKAQLKKARRRGYEVKVRVPK